MKNVFMCVKQTSHVHPLARHIFHPLLWCKPKGTHSFYARPVPWLCAGQQLDARIKHPILAHCAVITCCRSQVQWTTERRKIVRV